MYCPQCAAQNVNDAKFCRVCRADLETVALALADQQLSAGAGKPQAKDLKAEEKWLEKRGQGVRNTVQGAILVGTAKLIAIALALFSNKADWMIIWTVFFGWLACWGAITLAFGVGAFLESAMMLRHIKQATGRGVTQTKQLLPDDSEMIPAIATSPELSSQASVTEHTTEPLDKRRPSLKQTN